MSERALSGIEDAIARLAEAQVEICTQLSRLADKVAALEAARNGEARRPSQSELIEFLDGFRAAEALGEASLGAWIEVSDAASVRGGLRTIQLREGMHARLLEQRIKELGGAIRAEIPEVVHSQVMRSQADPERSDAEKLAEFVERFPDVDAAIQPILLMADRLEHDPETQSMLRTIAQDERSTLEFLSEICQRLHQGQR